MCLFVPGIYMHARLHRLNPPTPLSPFSLKQLLFSCVCVRAGAHVRAQLSHLLPHVSRSPPHPRLAICMDDSRSPLTSGEDAAPINNVKDVSGDVLLM